MLWRVRQCAYSSKLQYSFFWCTVDVIADCAVGARKDVLEGLLGLQSTPSHVGSEDVLCLR